MAQKNENFDEIKNNFVESLMNVSREQITEFIKCKGKEPKKIKPIICLNENVTKKQANNK